MPGWRLVKYRGSDSGGDAEMIARRTAIKNDLFAGEEALAPDATPGVGG